VGGAFELDVSAVEEVGFEEVGGEEFGPTAEGEESSEDGVDDGTRSVEGDEEDEGGEGEESGEE